MQFPKLTPLQSRFAASFAASLVLVILFLTLSRPQFAYAFEADSIEHRDHNHPFLLDHGVRAEALATEEDDEVQKYLPGFAEWDRSLLGRAPDSPFVNALSNNEPGQLNYSPGGPAQFWSFSKSELDGQLSSETQVLPPSGEVRRDHTPVEDEDNGRENIELRRRQNDQRTYYLTLNVCDQPTPTTSNPSGTPPPLQIYISHDPNNKYPESPSATVYLDYAWNGYFYYTTETNGDVYVGVKAENDTLFQGQYNYELTISIDEPYAAYQDFQSLYWLDSDSSAALFVSNNLTTNNSTNSSNGQAWMNSGSPFSIFVHDKNDVTFSGLIKSFCGIKKHAQIIGNLKGLNTTDVEVKMTTIGGGYPKEQFLVKNLLGNSQYYAVMALESNYSSYGPGNVNGGGNVWNAITFNTKAANSSCQLLYNLDFCDGVSYAVPTNQPYSSNYSGLASAYDNNTKSYFTFFQYSLDQIPCETTPSAQYSLAVNCSTCGAAYKQWLCAVTIPRCTDFSSQEPYLQPRRIETAFSGNNSFLPEDVRSGFFNSSSQVYSYFNYSRNSFIDNTIQPGPYKELLPCESLCNALVQNCPASLQFACPLQETYRNYSYGSVGLNSSEPECNIPGMIWGINSSSRPLYNVMMFGGAIIIALSICIVGVY